MALESPWFKKTEVQYTVHVHIHKNECRMQKIKIQFVQPLQYIAGNSNEGNSKNRRIHDVILVSEIVWLIRWSKYYQFCLLNCNNWDIVGVFNK